MKADSGRCYSELSLSRQRKMAEEVLFKCALRPEIFDLIPRKQDQGLSPDVSDGSESVAQEFRSVI